MIDYGELQSGLNSLPEPLPDFDVQQSAVELDGTQDTADVRATVPETVYEDMDDDIETPTHNPQAVEVIGVTVSAAQFELDDRIDEPEPENTANLTTAQEVEQPSEPVVSEAQHLQQPTVEVAGEQQEPADNPVEPLPEATAEPAENIAPTDEARDEPLENITAGSPPDVPPTEPPELPTPGPEEPEEPAYQLRYQQTEHYHTIVNESHTRADDIGDMAALVLDSGVPLSWDHLPNEDSPEVFFVDDKQFPRVFVKSYLPASIEESARYADSLPPNQAMYAESARLYGNVEHELAIAPIIEGCLSDNSFQLFVERHGFSGLRVITPMIVGHDLVTDATFAAYPWEDGVVPAHTIGASPLTTNRGEAIRDDLPTDAVEKIDVVVDDIASRLRYAGIEPYELTAANIMVVRDPDYGKFYGPRNPLRLKLFNYGQFVHKPKRKS